MVKANKVLVALSAIVLSLGLTGCGKDKYEGTYTGYEIRTPSTTGTTTSTTPASYSTTRVVTMTLSNSGDVVQGTYQVSAQAGGYTGGYTGGNYGTNGAESYQFTASSTNSGQLSNVMMFYTPSGTASYSMYSNCVMQGSLASANKGQTLSGTLSPVSSGASNCGTLQLQLTRSN